MSKQPKANKRSLRYEWQTDLIVENHVRLMRSGVATLISEAHDAATSKHPMLERIWRYRIWEVCDQSMPVASGTGSIEVTARHLVDWGGECFAMPESQRYMPEFD